jgi:hypothetical protein
MAWFGEKIWSWVGIPTPEGRWVFLHVWAVLQFLKKKLHGSGSGSFEGNSESKESPIPFISNPLKN